MEHKGINDLNDINETTVGKMSYDLDIVNFYNNYTNYVAEIMITPVQVAVVYADISDVIFQHDDLIRVMKELLKDCNDDSSIISIRLGNELTYDEDGQINGSNKVLVMGQLESDEEVTEDMIKTMRLLYRKLLLNQEEDIQHNEVEKVIEKIRRFEEYKKMSLKKSEGTRKIIGVPIEKYIRHLLELLNNQGQDITDDDGLEP